ncbi:MAG: NAD(P)-dependent glycerol-3-phosphate dehydrogenase [Deltaproteobacteria bacterium]|nr:NAD(P)-dependent glycerol-3-phosphate dehydrogenase [Deltaproteobacteria bacterium]
MTKMDPVVVLGAGSWGTTIADLAARNGHPVTLWVWPGDAAVADSVNARRRNLRYLPGFELSPGIRATTDLAEACAASDLVFIVVPSEAVRGLMRDAAPHLAPRHVLVSATKGLEPPALTRMTRIVEEETRAGAVAAISGPNLAGEIVRGHPAATVVASEHLPVIERVHDVLGGPRFRVYGSRDRTGVELCGALKNIYAIGSGMAAGLGYGTNASSFFLTRAAAEMRRLGTMLGADPETFHGIAGFGDLVATATSPLSRNWRLGNAVVKGTPLAEALRALGQVAEGVPTTRAVHAYAAEHAIDMPQAAAIHAVLFEGIDPKDAVLALMTRPVLFET